MELLRWFLRGLWTLLQMYVQFWAQLGTIIGDGLGLTVPPEIMSGIGVIVGVLLLGGGIVRAFTWNRKGNRPQAITLYTAQTPYDVVGKDLAGLVRLVITAIAVGIVLAILIARVTPLP